MAKPVILKNPTWVKDELILALDLYFRLEARDLSKSHPEIIALSELLNDLHVHPQDRKNRKFRNPTGVHMKLRNFIRFDNERAELGLERGGQMEGEVWNEFSADRGKLRATAQAIKENYKFLHGAVGLIDEGNEEESFSEGKILSRVHRLRERNATIIKKKKEEVFKDTGKLECEVCNFDFSEQYGDLGKGYAECHHTLPLSTLKGQSKTKLSDLAIVCANCHRMLHRSNHWLSVAELKEVVVGTRIAVQPT
jgi:5-methylcytosine-specific restriction protein A